MIHRLVLLLRKWWAAVQHVRTGGASTRTKARRRAGREPRTCTHCHQPIQHSTDWRDHLHT